MAATRPVTGATEMAEAAFERAIDARRDDAYAARGRVRRILRHIGTFLVDWFPIFVVMFVYDAIHNRLGRLLPPAHTLPQIHVEQALFGATVPTVRMQQAFYSASHPHWWDFMALAVYTSHFVVPPLVGLALWIRSRARYLRFMVWFIGMTTLGYLTYVLFPAVPPWLASQQGNLAPTHRLVRELWDYLGFHNMAALFSGVNVYANDVAAIPSLHAAYPLMITMFFWETSPRAVRAALALYSVAMALVLVYGAEHYLLDIVLGWLYALVTAWLVNRLWPADWRRVPLAHRTRTPSFMTNRTSRRA